MNTLRLPVAILASLILVFAAQVTAPAPAEAAGPCYYGAWQYSDLTTIKSNLRIRSSVKYRIGYTCGGTPMDAYHIDWRKMWIDIFDGGWVGYPRDWMAFHVYNGLNYPARYDDPNQYCNQARCSFYREFGGDVYGIGWDPYVYAFCWSCTPTGFSNLIVEHHFRAGWIWATYDGANCSPGPGSC